MSQKKNTSTMWILLSAFKTEKTTPRNENNKRIQKVHPSPRVPQPAPPFFPRLPKKQKHTKIYKNKHVQPLYLTDVQRHPLLPSGHQVGTEGALMSLDKFLSSAATRITRSLSVPSVKAKKKERGGEVPVKKGVVKKEIWYILYICWLLRSTI